MSRRKTSPRVINVIMLFTGMLLGYALVTLVISLYDSYRASQVTIEISTQEIPAEAKETPPPTEISDQGLKEEKATEPKTWTPAIPIEKKGRQFVGLRITGRTFLAGAPKGFNQIPGQDENGNPEMLLMGYVEGPTRFAIKLPIDIKQVEVEVGIPGAGGHRFTVTQ